MLGVRSPQSQYQDLVDSFGSTDPIEELGLSGLHITVLDLDAKLFSLDDQLAVTSRDNIDQEDYTGRTALSWAAQRGDIKAIEKLLKKGANPDKADAEGKTPLLHCNNDSNCLRTLLEAGAHVNQAEKLENTKLIYTVIENGDILSLELLFHYGADLNHHGNLGDTPLHISIKYRKPTITDWLLGQGVDTNAINETGETPLSRDISNNAGYVMTLLDKGADYKVKDFLQEGLLHTVARFAQLSTIALLKDIDLTGLSPYERSYCGFKLYEKVPHGKTAMELAMWRRDSNQDWSIECYEPMDPDPQAWFTAFEAFVNSIPPERVEIVDQPVNNAATFQTTSTSLETTAKGESTRRSAFNEGHDQNDYQLEASPRLPGSFPEDEEHRG